MTSISGHFKPSNLIKVYAECLFSKEQNGVRTNTDKFMDQRLADSGSR